MGKKDRERYGDVPAAPSDPASRPEAHESKAASTVVPENDPTLSPADPVSLATDVTPAPSVDEAVWDGTHWTHSGRVWDGSNWVSSPELLADRRAQATDRFQLASVRLLKALTYAVLSLIGVIFAGASLVVLGDRDYKIGVIAGLSFTGLFALVSLSYLWRRDRPRS